MNSEPAGNKHLGDAKASSFNPATSQSSIKDTVAATASTVSNAVPTSVNELKAQLAQAQEGGLRMRKAAGVGGESSTGTSDTGMQQLAPQGVPVQIVAALCLISFLLAYLFF